MGEVVGYARVSTTDQDEGGQAARIEAAGAARVFRERVSGARSDRPELARAMDYVRDGDTLVVTKLDRLARSTRHLYEIVDALKAKGVALRALDQSIDTGTPAGRAFLGMLAIFAEFERDIIRERQAEGIARAKARGVYRGRPPTHDAAAILDALKTEGPAAVARRFGCSERTVYRIRDRQPQS